jgi:hypothetical protein
VQYPSVSLNPIESPCDGCRHAPVCAANGQSCRAFQKYVNGSVAWRKAPREPTVIATAMAALRDRAQAKRDVKDELRRQRKARRLAEKRLAPKLAAKECAPEHHFQRALSHRR